MASSTVRLLVLAAALAAGTAVSAANWVAAGVDANRTYYLDLDSVTTPEVSGNRRLWIKIDLTDLHRRASYALEQWEVRCPMLTAHILSSATYRADGSVLDQTSTPFSVPAQTEPGTVRRRVADIACGSAAPPAVPAPMTDPAALIASTAVPVFEDDLPGAHYRVIGPVRVQTHRTTAFASPADRAKFYARLWEEARALGADAVIHAAVGASPGTFRAWGGAEASGEAIKLVPAN